MSDPLIYYTGDRNPSISETITVNGVAFDLTNSTVKFKMRAVGSSTLKVDAVAVVVSPATGGNVRYDWLAADVDTAGSYLAWWEVTTSGKVQAMQEALVEFRAHAPASPIWYGDLTELKATLALTGTQFADLDLERALEAASRAIDGICWRRFYSTGSDETRVFSPYVGSWVDAGDIISITTLKSDPGGDGTFEETWTANTDYVLEPLNAALDSRPYSLVRRHPKSNLYFPSDYPRSVQIAGRFGWNAVPPEIEQATIIVASQLLQRARQAPFGVVGVGLDQASAVRLARVDPQVAALVGPYVRAPGPDR